MLLGQLIEQKERQQRNNPLVMPFWLYAWWGVAAVACQGSATQHEADCMAIPLDATMRKSFNRVFLPTTDDNTIHTVLMEGQSRPMLCSHEITDILMDCDRNNGFPDDTECCSSLVGHCGPG